MSNILKEIEQLNKKIDSLNIKKTKSDAQRGVWENNLKEGIKAYNEKYGTNLVVGDIKGIKASLSSEINSVAEKTQQEFEKSSKIVAAIESGNIDEAWELLGTPKEKATDEVESVEEVQDNVLGEVAFTSSKGGETAQSLSEAMSDLDDSVFFGGNTVPKVEPVKEEPKVEEVKKAPEVVKTTKPVFNPFVDEDDDEEDEFIDNSKSSSSPFVDEDDSDEDPFGGFSSILQGTPFNPNK